MSKVSTDNNNGKKIPQSCDTIFVFDSMSTDATEFLTIQKANLLRPYFRTQRRSKTTVAQYSLSSPTKSSF